MKIRYSHLSLSERRKIERWRQMKLSPNEMARRPVQGEEGGAWKAQRLGRMPRSKQRQA